MEVKIAEQFLIKQGCQRMCCDDLEGNGIGDFFEDVQPKDLIEFAKMHVYSIQNKNYLLTTALVVESIILGLMIIF